MIIDELITLLEFDTSGEDKAEAYKDLMKQIEDVAKVTAATLTAAVASVAYFAKEVADSTAENYEWAESAGVGIETYQKMDHVAQVLGGTLEDVKDDMEMWARSANASGTSIEDIFLREAKSVEGLSKEQSRALLSQKGYSDKAIKAIQLGEDELKKLMNQAQILPEKSLKASVKFAKTWRSLFSQIHTSLAAGVASSLPALESLMEMITNFINRNNELISSHVGAFFTSVAIMAKTLFLALSPIIFAVEGILKALDFLSFGMAKYLVIIPTLTALLLALSIAMGIKTVFAIKNLIAYTTTEIAKIGKLLVTIKARLIAERVDLLMKGKQMVANRVLMAQEIKRNASLASLIGWKIKQTLITIKETAITWYEIASKRVAMLTEISYGRVLSTSITWIKAAAAASFLWIGAIWKKIVAKGVEIAQLISEKITLISINILYGIITAATWLWTAAQWALNVALIANPIGLTIAAVVVGIGLIIGLIVLIIKYWDEIVNKTLLFGGIIKKIATTIFVVFKAVFEILFNFIKNFITHWLDGWMKIIKMVKGFPSFIKSIFGSIFSWMTDKVKNLAGAIYDEITSKIKMVISWIERIPGVKLLVDMFKKSSGEKEVDSDSRGFYKRAAAQGKWERNANNSTEAFAGPLFRGPKNTATASPSQVNNSSRNIVINNNNVVNTSASSGPAIANYLKRSNPFNGAGYNGGGNI